MGDPVIINLRHVARGLDIPLPKVQAVVELLDEGNTVPFITRYRKDQTGGLDEEQIRLIQARLAKMRMLAERKQTILRSIESQGKLSEKLARQIHSASTTKRLEDLYLPFKPKKQTLATLARNRGLGPLAHAIIAADPTAADLDGRAADFVDPDRQVPTAADALLGAGHILPKSSARWSTFASGSARFSSGPASWLVCGSGRNQTAGGKVPAAGKASAGRRRQAGREPATARQTAASRPVGPSRRRSARGSRRRPASRSRGGGDAVGGCCGLG